VKVSLNKLQINKKNLTRKRVRNKGRIYYKNELLCILEYQRNFVREIIFKFCCGCLECKELQILDKGA
jgi:hypothetical protein